MFSPMWLRSLHAVMHVSESQSVDETAAALAKKLSAEVGVVSWEALSPHASRGALFWVDAQLDLVEVGVALAMDDVKSVRTWHEEGMLLLASASGPEDFSAFRFLIVQPFVLAAPLELPPMVKLDTDQSS